MSDRIYKAVIEYLKTRDNGWRFILGGQVYDRDTLIVKMEKDKEFREFVIEEVVKTAVELLVPNK